jgi:hypothetical protein
MSWIKRIDEIYKLHERTILFSGDRLAQYYRIEVCIKDKSIDEITETIEICKDNNVYLEMKSFELGLMFP